MYVCEQDRWLQSPNSCCVLKESGAVQKHTSFQLVHIKITFDLLGKPNLPLSVSKSKKSPVLFSQV